MPVSRSALLLIASQGARLAGPSLALLLLAALWPADAFGRFASAYALAALLGLLPATGLSAWLLDQGARHPGATRTMLWRAWAVLAALALPLLAVALILAAALPAYDPLLLAALALAMLLAGAADNGFAALRSQRREAPVAAIALPANLALLATAAALHDQGAAVIAAAWVAVRALQVTAISVAASAVLPPLAARPEDRQGAWPFFGSQAAGVLYGQADTLLVHAVAGEAAAGFYAIAIRLLQLASFAAQTLMQWFQPRLAAVAAGGEGWLAERRRLWRCLAAVAGIGAAGFVLLPPVALPPLAGAAYAPVVPLLQIAGPVLAARCFVAGKWIELTARQCEAHRARDSWLLLALFLALAWPLAVQFGTAGAMGAHLLALGPIAALSGRSLAHARQRNREPLKRAHVQ